MLSWKTRGKPKFLEESCELLKVPWQLFHHVAVNHLSLHPSKRENTRSVVSGHVCLILVSMVAVDEQASWL
jgi:hypothetical protein